MIYKVIVDISASEVDKMYDYRGAEGIEPGTRVIVPFGGRLTEGYVTGVAETSRYSDKLKDIEGVPDDYPVVIGEMIHLAEFMKRRYNLKTVDCMRIFVPSEIRNGKVKELVKAYARIAADRETAYTAIRKNAVKQKELLDYLDGKGSESVGVLKSRFGAAAYAALKEKGVIYTEEKALRRTPLSLVRGDGERHVLTEAQQACVDAVLKEPDGRFLIHGVTGSGKTEIYMNIIESVLQRGKTAIMLVPEISLTPGVMSKFRKRFGESVALLHSGLSAGEKYDEWRRLREGGEARIATGARSAVFAPLENIGAVIIDEEHDGSYQSESNPRYNTMEVAKERAVYNKCALILGSATPSLESYYAAQRGEYKLLVLPERINGKPLPEVEIVDMVTERMKGWSGFLSQKLQSELKRVVSAGEQAILFLNRRGYSSFVMCSKCGYVAKCEDCEVSLTYHMDENVLKCHYCGKKYRMFDICPQCKSEYLRQGKIGTEQVVNEIKKILPGVNVLRMDYDTTKTKESHFNILSEFRDRKAQVLVGTQMVTKGHDFPFVTLVGVIEGDQSLYLEDYRSAERTFQLITQVAGRCGRKDLKGRVVLQTHTPNHYALTYASRQDYVSFYKREINIREATKFPPFCTILRVLYTGEDEQRCIERVNADYKEIENIKLRENEAFIFLQKMRSPIKRIESRFRFQILMRIEVGKTDEITESVYAVINANKTRGVSVFAEINPQSMS